MIFMPLYIGESVTLGMPNISKRLENTLTRRYSFREKAGVFLQKSKYMIKGLYHTKNKNFTTKNIEVIVKLVIQKMRKK